MKKNVEIPVILQSKAELVRKYFADLSHPLKTTVYQLCYVSDYAYGQREHLNALLKEDDCRSPLDKHDYEQLVSLIPLDLTEPFFAKALRSFRNRHLLRLLLREGAGLASTENTMACWSYCADALIVHTLRYCEQEVGKRHGEPVDHLGERSILYVLAMGKLGGEELNFSSDIDLIFAYSLTGHTTKESPITNEAYFTKVIQQFIQLLQKKTMDGFVFRVDLRLRPNGDSGPLVTSFAAMESYYQEQGRDWERYAMVKARAIPYNSDSSWFDRLIPPFVYRRYVDFSVIESLRSMKSMIEREIRLNPMLDDIKRGSGGIREVEFTIQCFQLIRGGRIPKIQHQNAMTALNSLKEEGLLAHTAVLKQAYLFLRQLENALQMQNDQQTHALPIDDYRRAQLCFAMGELGFEELLSKLQQYQRIISHAFHAVLGRGGLYQDEKRLLMNQLNSLWHGHLEHTMATHLLSSLGFKDAQHCYQMLHAFRNSSRCRRLSQTARIRLDRFMVMLFIELEKAQEADVILLQVLILLENIVGRSAYLALLSENPAVLKELLHWFAHSPFISSLIVNQPFLLEVLIDQELNWRPPSRAELKSRLAKRLAHRMEEEAEDEVMRQFKLTCWLLAARAEWVGHYNAIQIGQFLADVAHVLVVEVLDRACLRLRPRFKTIMKIKAAFTIIAYGKLGSREMNYDSDVDLVFLHHGQPSDESLVIRLTQKMLHMLTVRLQSGILYQVDTRLRPSGSAGLLVSHLDAFKDYQKTDAWTWEHQALLRARILFSSASVRRVFLQLKQDVLFLPRDRQALLNDVITMRHKISNHVDGDAIKHVVGGLLDLEFLVQFLMLAHPAMDFIKQSNTLVQLKSLYTYQQLSSIEYKQLRRAYIYYHQVLHQNLLQLKPISMTEHQEAVLSICQKRMV